MLLSGSVLIIIDDILVAPEGIEEYLEVLIHGFHLLQNLYMTWYVSIQKLKMGQTQYESFEELNLEKINWFNKRLNIWVMSLIKMECVLINIVLKLWWIFLVSKNTRLCQSYMEICSYFRNVIPGFSLIAKPLYDLISKDSKFKMVQTQYESFDKITRMLISCPVLSEYNPRDENEPHCDESAIDYGAVLMQWKGIFHLFF